MQLKLATAMSAIALFAVYVAVLLVYHLYSSMLLTLVTEPAARSQRSLFRCGVAILQHRKLATIVVFDAFDTSYRMDR